MNFYKLSKDFNFKDIDYSTDTDWTTIKCSKIDGHQRAGKRIGNFKFLLNGNVDREFYWTFLSELVVAENFIDVLNRHNITGFNINKAFVLNKVTDIEFFEFLPIGKGGFAKNVELVETCAYCGFKRYKEADQGDNVFLPKRVFINPQQWDGSDIFTLTGLERMIFITEKLKTLIVESHFLGAIISKAENFDEKVYVPD